MAACDEQARESKPFVSQPAKHAFFLIAFDFALQLSLPTPNSCFFHVCLVCQFGPGLSLAHPLR